MKFKPLHALYAPEEGDGSSNGGGTPQVKGVASITDFGGSEDIEDDAEDSDEPDMQEKIAKIGRKISEPPKSVLFDSLQKTMKEDEERANLDRGKKPKAEEEEKEEQKDDDKEEDEIDKLFKIKPTNKNGSPISVPTGELIDKFKATITEQSKKIKQYEQEKNTNPELVTLRQQLTEKEAKLKEIQDKMDEEFFENSEAFKETYSKPLDKTVEQISKLLRVPQLQKDGQTSEVAAIKEAWAQASQLAASGDYEGFLEAIDGLAEEYVKGGAATRNAFLQRANTYFEQFSDFAKAHAEKGDNRKKIVEQRMQEVRSRNVGSVDNTVTQFVKKFEADKKALIDQLPPQLKEKYVGSFKDAEKTVKTAISKFSVDGKIPSELQEIIAKGVSYDALTHENVLAWGAIKDAKNQIEILKEELATAKGKLAKYTKQPESRSYGTGYSGSEKRKGSGSAIFDSMQNAER